MATATVFCYPNVEKGEVGWLGFTGEPQNTSGKRWENFAQYGVHNGSGTPNESSKATSTATKERICPIGLETPKQALEREKPGTTFLKVKASGVTALQMYFKEGATKALELQWWEGEALSGEKSTKTCEGATASPAWVELTGAAGIRKKVEENQVTSVQPFTLLAKVCQVYIIVLPVEVEYEEGATQVGGTTKIKFKGALTETVAAVIGELVSKIKFKDSTTVSSTMSLAPAAVKLAFRTQNITPEAKIRPIAETKVRFHATDTVSSSSTLEAASKIRFKEELTPTVAMPLKAQSKVTFRTQQFSMPFTMNLQTTSKIRFLVHGNVTEEGKGGVKRTVLYIFED